MLEPPDSSDSYPSPSNTLTRPTLQLNQCLLSLQAWGPNLTLPVWFDGRKDRLKARVSGVRTLLGPPDSSDSHPSPSNTLTRQTLQLYQCLLSLQAWGPNLTLLVYFDGRKGRLKARVTDVRTLLGPTGSLDSHPSPFNTLTRLTLHLNQSKL